MRGISEKQLEDARNNAKLNWDARRAIDIVLHLIPLSELQEPWMTLEGFLKSGFEGFCWIKGRNNEILLADFIENDFYIAESSNRHDISKITHVMPIHKPEPPR